MQQVDLSKLRAEGDRAVPMRKINGTGRVLPTGTSGSALISTIFPKIDTLCEPWLPEGVTILAGPPKTGKSTLARQITRAVGTGGDLWGRRCRSAAVAYLSLEEGERLMQKKLRAAGTTAEELAKVTFHWTWRRGADGCEDLRLYLAPRPDVGLVVVDSLTMFRAAAARDKPQFQQDYEAVAGLGEVAKARPGLAILVLHHVTKTTNSDNPIADISGTFGVSAAADSYMVLRKEAGTFVLYCGGRHWDQDSDSFVIERANQAWTMRGAHDGVSLTPLQREYLARVVDEGTVTTKGMASRFGRSESSSSELLKELANKGMVERTSAGWVATREGRTKAAPLPTHTEPPEEREVVEGSEASEGLASGLRRLRASDTRGR